MEVSEAHRRLIEELDGHPELTIAVSGGIDSMTLAYLAHRFGQRPVGMVHAVSPAVPETATARVRDYAAREGWTLRLVDAGEFADADYLANPVNRCYFCKTNLYQRIGSLTAGPIASGANVDDLSDFRPGLTAAAEHAVVHPYVEAGIGKSAIRALARLHHLADLAELPAQPCLASRVETGIGIDAADLRFIDEVEERLRTALGRSETVRCRITHGGVVVEIGEGAVFREGIAEELAAVCARDGRVFAGIRAYRRGAAFLREAGAASGDAARP